MYGMNKKHKNSNWKLPENYKYYFDATSDEEFKKKHPVGYIFLVVSGLAVFLLPAMLFAMSVGLDNNWVLLGIIGGLIFGIGLFNFIAVIINQYLGHWVSIISLGVGGIMMLISYLVCKY